MELKEILNSIQDKHMKNMRMSKFYNPNNATPAFLSNQFDFARIITGLLNHESLKIPGKRNVAFLLGESFFLSLATALTRHVDEVVFVDIDHRVLSHNRFMLDCMSKSTTMEEFCRNISSDDNPLISSKAIFAIELLICDPQGNVRPIKDTNRATAKTLLTELFAGSIIGLKDYHFLLNDALFKKAKDAVSRLKFHTLEIDLLNTDLMLELGMSLSAHSFNVSILNFSNLFDYDADIPIHEADTMPDIWRSKGTLFKSIANLVSRPEEVKIIYGLMDLRKQHKPLTSRMVTGLSEYKDYCEAYSAAVNLSCMVERGTGPMHHFGIFSPKQFLKPKSYNLNEKCYPVIFSSFKAALDELCPGLKISCHVVKNTQHQLVDMLLGAPLDHVGDMVKVLDHLKDLFKALVMHDISYQIKNVEGKEYICIMDINLPIQRQKMMDMVEEIEMKMSSSTPGLVK